MAFWGYIIKFGNKVVKEQFGYETEEDALIDARAAIMRFSNNKNYSITTEQRWKELE